MATPAAAVIPDTLGKLSAGLSAQIDAAIKAVPAAKRGSLALEASRAGASLSVGWRATERWDVGASAGWAPGGWHAGVKARYTW